MSPEAISALIAAGPWVVVAVIIVAVARRIESQIWIHANAVDRLIGQYEVRLGEHKETIERQQSIIRQLGGITDGTLDLADQFTRSESEQRND